MVIKSLKSAALTKLPFMNLDDDYFNNIMLLGSALLRNTYQIFRQMKTITSFDSLKINNRLDAS